MLFDPVEYCGIEIHKGPVREIKGRGSGLGKTWISLGRLVE
jgi:hypothetical protein